jgi:transcriptional regulator with XRE-family HTH domain
MKQSRYSSDYSHFLAELKDARRETGLSQAQLAEALGQLQNYVSKCELGNRRLDVIELRAWVVALGGDPVSFAAGLEERLARSTKPSSELMLGKRRSGKP